MQRRASAFVLSAALLIGAAASAYSSIAAVSRSQIPAAMNDRITDYGLLEAYAQTAWPGIHRDSSNSDFVPFVAPRAVQKKWTGLDGAAVLTAVTIGPEGNLYVTTGQATASTLHAFNRKGDALWSANLDAAAVGSSAIVDAGGDLYISDSDQLWAFHADGRVKWVAPVPDAVPANFVTAIFSVEGYVGGITVNGVIVLFNRRDGTVVNQLPLPPGIPLPPSTTPPGLWGQGLMDPSIIGKTFAAFFGTGAQVVNTPAVNPLNNRIYITAAGPSAGNPPQPRGILYGIDITSGGGLRIVFAAAMGPGSGTSPTISPDGSQVYVSDGVGSLYAFDALTDNPAGRLIWRLTIGQSAGSPSVHPDGTIYSLGDGRLLAISSESGSVLWIKDFNSHASGLAPIGTLPRVGKVDSIISVAPNGLYVTATIGHEILLPPSNVPFVVPLQTSLYHLGFDDGSLLAPPVALRDTVEGFATIASDGSIYVTHGAMRSSVAAYGVIPGLTEPLKSALDKVVARPAGGITALEPVSFLKLVETGIQWVQQLQAASLARLDGGAVADVNEAYTLTRRGVVQLDATASTIGDAEARGEIKLRSALQARQRVKTAETLLNNAKSLLARARTAPAPTAPAAARILIRNSGRELEHALSALEQ